MKRHRHLRSFAACGLATIAGFTLIPGGAHGATGGRHAPSMPATAAAPTVPARAVEAPVGPTTSGATFDAFATQGLHPQAATARLTRRQRVVNKVNYRRRNRGLRPLRMAPKPVGAAKSQARYQARIRTVTHRGPRGGNAGNRLTNRGYPWWMWGEAVAGGYSKPKAVVRAWMNSRPHRKVLMHPKARHIGVWSSTDGRGRRYWTLVVANR